MAHVTQELVTSSRFARGQNTVASVPYHEEKRCRASCGFASEFHREWHEPDPVLEEGQVLHAGNDKYGPCDTYISSNGRFLLRQEQDDTWKVWDLQTQCVVRCLPEEACPSCSPHMAVSCDGTFVVLAARSKTLEVWDLASGTCTATLTGHTSFISALALSPDGSKVVSGTRDGSIRVWDRITKSCIRAYEGHTGHTCLVHQVVISSDGRFAASAGGCALMVWDLQQGSRTAALQGMPNEDVVQLAISPDGSTVVTASGRSGLVNVRMWDIRSKVCTGAITTCTNGIAIHPGAQHVVYIDEMAYGSLAVCDVAAPHTCRASIFGPQGARWVRVSPGGRYLVVGYTSGAVWRWDLTRHIDLEALSAARRSAGASVAGGLGPEGVTSLAGSVVESRRSKKRRDLPEEEEVSGQGWSGRSSLEGLVLRQGSGVSGLQGSLAGMKAVAGGSMAHLRNPFKRCSHTVAA